MKKGMLFLYMTAFLSANALNLSAQEAPVPADRWSLGRWDQIENFKKKLSRSVFSGSDVSFVTGVETSLEKVYKDKYQFKGEITDRVNISCAKNEYESFQLAVIPVKDKPLTGVNVKFSELSEEKAGAVIGRSNIKIWTVGYVETETSIHPTFTGEWPDPLLDFKPFDLGKNELRPIWIEIYVPEYARAGIYEGKITVSAGGNPGTEFTINLNVMDFTLPKEQVYKECTYASLRSIRSWYGKEPEREMFRKYCEYFLEHGVNPLNVGKDLYNKDDYDAFDNNIEFALNRGQAVFDIPRVKGAELIKLCNHLKEKDYFDKAMVYGYKDEPAVEDYPAFRKDSEEIRNAVPDLKIFMAETPDPGLYGAVDIWWSSMVSDNDLYIKERLDAGDEVWWYRCGIPVRLEYNRPYWEYPSDVLVDRSSVDMRIFYWMVWKFKMTPGSFFWNGISWGKSIPRDWHAQNTPIKLPEHGSQTVSGTRNGDGFVLYPGPDGPLPSIRIKCIRDGIEDYEYLWLLNKELEEILKEPGKYEPLIKETEDILSVSHELIVETNYYSKDPKKLLFYRDKVAAQILKIKGSRK